jgi:hypothetical protein
MVTFFSPWPVPALEAQVLDVDACGLRDPQPVQRQQGDQRMLGRQAETGGHQQGAELAAAQRDGVGFVVHPRAADVRGGRVVDEFLFDRVLVEPGDGAQTPRDGRAGPAPGFQVAGEAFDVGPADGEQAQAASPAPGGELA